MDLRTLKKRQKEAVEILVRDHGYKREAFTPADGDETIDAPADLDDAHVQHGFIEPGLHKGTLVHWARCSYEYDEWDCKLPSEILAEILHWDAMTEDDVREMLADGST